jgi:hypothetical protein
MTSKPVLKTWVDGVTVFAEELNSQLRDSINAIWVGTNANDMERYVDANNKARIPIGVNSQVLTVNSGIPGWAWGKPKDGFKVVSSFTTSSTSMVDVTSSSFTLTTTAKSDIFALMVGQVLINTNTTAELYLSINGVSTLAMEMGGNCSGLNLTFPVNSFVRYTSLAAGTHTIKLMALSNAGTSITFKSGSIYAWAWPVP